MVRVLSWREFGARDAGRSGAVPFPVRCCRCCRRGAALVNSASQSDSSVTRRWSRSAVRLARLCACQAACLSRRAGVRSSRASSRACSAASNRSLAASKLPRPASSRPGRRRAHPALRPACGAGRPGAASVPGVPAPRQPQNRGCQAVSAGRRAGCTARHRDTGLAATPSAPHGGARWDVPVAHSSGAPGQWAASRFVTLGKGGARRGETW